MCRKSRTNEWAVGDVHRALVSYVLTANAVATQKLHVYSFITEYYKRLQKNPSQLRQLFHDGAEFSHASGDQVIYEHISCKKMAYFAACSHFQEVTPVVGLDAVSAEIEKIGFENARIDLSNGSVDCQQSHDGIIQ